MDLINFKYLVHSNALNALTQLLDGLNILSIPLDPEIKEDVGTFRLFCAKSSSDGREQFDLDLDAELAQRIERIWNSHCIQAVFRKRFSITLLQGAERYLNDIHRLADANYAPDVEDILICRKLTIGVQEIFFSYKELTFNMVDVGGQKSERRKWIHCFDDVKLILFIAAMSDYDVISQETDTNCLLESLEIFESICTNPFLSKASVTLFLNKKDIFEQKLTQGISLNTSFPDYKGINNYETASAFISEKFGSRLPNASTIHTFMTTATDTENVDKVFASTAEHIIRTNLGNIGLSI